MTPAPPDLLLEGPSSAIEHLRSLYVSRGSSILDPQDELVLAISQLSPHFCIRGLGFDGDRSSTGDAMALLRGELWRACISSELLILLLEMMNKPSFSAQPQAWIVNVLTSLGGLLSAWYLCIEQRQRPNEEPRHPLPNQGQLERMFALFHPTWQNLWAHIDDFLDPRCDVVGSPGLILGLLVSISGDMQCMCGTVYRDMVASTETKMRVLLDVDYIPVILFAWTHATLRGGRGNLKLRSVPVLMSGYRDSVDGFNDALAQIHSSDEAKVSWSNKFDKVISHVGQSEVIEAFHIVLVTKDWMVDECLVNHLRELSTLLSPALSHRVPLREALWARSMTDALWAAWARQQYRESSTAQRWLVYLAWCKLCCDLLGIVGEGVDQNRCPATNGRFVICMFGMLCTTGLCGIPATLDSAIQASASDDFISCLSAVTTRWCEVIRASVYEIDVRPDVQRVLLGICLYAKEHWYTSLQTMRATQAKEDRTLSERYPRIIQCWVNLGKALDMDEDEERARHNAALARLCSWAACVHHRERTKEALPICKGCGEVRYCSRECQRRDWKEGGHRAKCRRLKS